MKTRIGLKYYVTDCLTSNSPHTPLNLICLTIFVTLRPLAQFEPKIRATNLQKITKICLT